MFSFVLISIVVHIFVTSSQPIPYSYAGGRNVTAVEERFQRFQAARFRNAEPTEFFEICGKVDEQFQCKVTPGRPSTSVNLLCDSLCCIAGYKIGNCGIKYDEHYGFQFDIQNILNELELKVEGGEEGYKKTIEAIRGVLIPGIDAKCFCSNDPIDVKCGQRGLLEGLNCSEIIECSIKYCREGKGVLTCGTGRFKKQCNCY